MWEPCEGVISSEKLFFFCLEPGYSVIFEMNGIWHTVGAKNVSPLFPVVAHFYPNTTWRVCPKPRITHVFLLNQMLVYINQIIVYISAYVIKDIRE